MINHFFQTMFYRPPPHPSHRSGGRNYRKSTLTCFVELIHFCNAFHRTGQNNCAPCASAQFMNASSPDSLAGKVSSLKKLSRDLRTSLKLRTALSSSWIPVYCLASSFACEARKSYVFCAMCFACSSIVVFILSVHYLFLEAGSQFSSNYVLEKLTIRPVALEGERSNCFSIIQLVGQKRQ